MRHRKKKLKLNRDYDHRRALLKNLARSFFIEGKLETTLTKAKRTGQMAEKMINRAQRDPLSGRRYLFSFFNDRRLVNQIYEKIVLRFKGKKGGITRIKKLKKRKGDDAVIALLSFADNKGGVKEKEKEEKKGKGKKKEKSKEKKK